MGKEFIVLRSRVLFWLLGRSFEPYRFSTPLVSGRNFDSYRICTPFPVAKLHGKAFRILHGRNFDSYRICTPFVSYSLRSVRYTQGFRILLECHRCGILRRNKKNDLCRFFCFVRREGFEPSEPGGDRFTVCCNRPLYHRRIL